MFHAAFELTHSLNAYLRLDGPQLVPPRTRPKVTFHAQEFFNWCVSQYGPEGVCFDTVMHVLRTDSRLSDQGSGYFKYS